MLLVFVNVNALLKAGELKNIHDVEIHEVQSNVTG